MTQKIQIAQSKISLRELFKTIEKQSDFLFFFVDSDIEGIMVIPPKDKSISEVLNAALKESSLTYSVNEKHITISKKQEDVLHKPTTKTIKGFVKGVDGVPLIGASILVKNSQAATTTDTDGQFLLEVAEDAVLIVSYVGYEAQEVKTGQLTSFHISLKENQKLLDEVVVIGYGTQRKVDVTGSIASVNMKDLQLTVASNAGEALQGQVAGINIRNSGLPGESSNMSVRGITSFGNVAPLIIIDGVESTLNNISAQDIESIQVLKDARVAAIYGVRGGNGVILVTSKKGKSGVPKITYSCMGGVMFPLSGNVFNLANSQEYMQILNIGQPGNTLFAAGMPDYLYNSPLGSGVAFEGDSRIDARHYLREEPNVGRNYLIQAVNKTGTDWFHEVFKKAFFQEHNLSVAGGGENSRYFFSLGYLDHKGTMIETYLKRYSMRINTEFNIGKYIKMGENLNFFYRSHLPVETGTQYGRIPDLYTLLPIMPVKDIMGNWGGTWIGPELGAGANPVAALRRMAANSDYDSYNVVGNIFAEVTLLRDLVFRTSFGLYNNNWIRQTYTGIQPEHAEYNTRSNSLSLSSQLSRRLTFSNTLNYKKEVGKHRFDLLLGMEMIQTYAKGLSGNGDNFFSNNKNYLLLHRAENKYPPVSSISQTALLSQFGRIDYNFDDRYLLGITVRRDGSSYFGPENRFGTFPSFSLGWRISQEKWMKNIQWLDDLKLRASYGVLGSQNNINAQNQFSTYTSSIYLSAYDIAGTGNSVVTGMYRSRIGNSATGWERDIVQNIGVDLVLFKNTLEVQLDLYKKRIDGLLLTEPLPSVIGALVDNPTVNIGDIQNTGFDLSVKYRFKIGDIHNSIAGNFTHYKNTIVNLPDPGYFTNNISRNQEGYPTGMFYGYKIMKIFDTQEEVNNAPKQDGALPGRFRYVDTVEDNQITPEDRQFLASPHPDFTYGFVLNSAYKGVDLALQFYGVQGNTIYNQVRMSTEFFASNITGNKSRKLLDAWTPENTDTTIPRIENVQIFSTTSAFHSYALEDGSYFRLKTLTLGYSFNPGCPFMRKIQVSNLRIYAQASNVFTITRYSGLDPDISSGSPSSFGIDIATYPTNEPKLTIGLTITY